MLIPFRVPAATSLLLVSIVLLAVELVGAQRVVADSAPAAKPLDFKTVPPLTAPRAEANVTAQKLSPQGERMAPLTTTGSPMITNVEIATVINQQSLPHAVRDGGGTIVVWEDTRGGPSDIYAQKLTQGSAALWQKDGQPVCKADGSQRYPRAVSDGAGGAIFVWQDSRSDGGDIYAQRLGPQGNPLWNPNGVVICSSVNVQQKPVIVEDGLGGAIIAWQDDRTAATSSDVWVQRINGAGVLQWAECGLVMCNASGPQQGLTIVSDNLRGAIVVWQDGRTDGGDIRAQRVEEHGFMVWLANGAFACISGGVQENPSAVIDNAGGVIVAWTDRRGASRDIFAQRLQNTGGIQQWTSDGVMVCGLTGDQRFPQVCEDGVGGAIIAWQDARPSGTGVDIYAQRASPLGAMQWTANGVAVCVAPNDQLEPVIAADPLGGSIVGWTDARTPANGQDVYAQHLTAAGGPVWTANGVQLCDAPNTQDAIRLIPDGVGGASLVWEDLRSGTGYDVYGERVDSNGMVPDQCTPPDSMTTGEVVSTIAPQNWRTFNQGNFYWSAVGVQGGSGDWDLEVFDIHSVGLGAYPLCFSRPMAGSYSTSGTDFVVMDSNDNLTPVGTYGVRVFRHSGTGSAAFEWDGDVQEILTDGSAVGSAVANWTGVIDTYDVLLTAGIPYWFELQHTNPSAQTRVFIYSSYGSVGTIEYKYVVPRSSYSAQSVGSYATFTSPTTDYYGVIVVNDNGLPDNYTLRVKTTVVDVEPTAGLVTRFKGASPNPSAGRAQFEFSLRTPGNVSFDVMDMAGRVTARVPAQRWGAGTWSVAWDGRRTQGVEAPPGIYFVQMRVDGRPAGLSRLALIR